MPTKCQDCGEYSYAIYLTLEYKRLCPKCYKKVRKENEKPDKGMDAELDKLPRRQVPGK